MENLGAHTANRVVLAGRFKRGMRVVIDSVKDALDGKSGKIISRKNSRHDLNVVRVDGAGYVDLPYMDSELIRDTRGK